MLPSVWTADIWGWGINCCSLNASCVLSIAIIINPAFYVCFTNKLVHLASKSFPNNSIVEGSEGPAFAGEIVAAEP